MRETSKPRISLRWFLSLQLGSALVVQFVIVMALAWHMLLPRMRADMDFHHYAFARSVAGDVSAQVLIAVALALPRWASRPW